MLPISLSETHEWHERSCTVSELTLLRRVIVLDNLKQVFVGEDSTVRFRDDFSTEDVGVASVADGDFASYQLSGGCVCLQPCALPPTPSLVDGGSAVSPVSRSDDVVT